MKVQISLSELTSLVRRINFEAAALIQSKLRTNPLLEFETTPSATALTSLVITSPTKKIEVRSVVIPFDLQLKDATGMVSLDGAKLEVIAFWRLDEKTLWIRNASFGERGSLIFSVPSLDQDYIEAVATTASQHIGKYLDVQIEVR